MVSHSIPTPLGEMIAVATDHALAMLEFIDVEKKGHQLEAFAAAINEPIQPATNAVIDRVEEELRRYFAGEVKEFSVPLQLYGTPFQQSVWNELQKISYGETWSYATLARRLGDIKTIRAAARANGENRIAIIIPCHRVIGSDGSLTGYAGGLWRKKELLELEGATAPIPEGQERLL